MPKSPKPKKERPPTPPPPDPQPPAPPEPEDLITPEQRQYLSGLLDRVERRAETAGGLMREIEEEFERLIEEGEYEIRDRQWSAKQEAQPLNIVNNASGGGNHRSQKQLENQLHLLQDQINSESRVERAAAISEQQRLAFLKKMEKQRKQLQKKKQEVMKAEKEHRQAAEKEKFQKAQKEEEERKMKRKQEIQERMKALEEQRRKKDEEFKAQSTALKEKLKEKIMIDRMEENYNRRQNESLQERKQRLAQIRTLHKPIDREQIDKHMARLQELHAERQAAAAEKHKLQQSTPAFYRSAFYKQVKQEQKVYLDQQNQEHVGKLRQARDRLKKFSQYIRTSYKPTIDEKKAEEIKFRSVSSQRRAYSMHQTDQTPVKLGLRYLEYSKMQADKDHKLLASSEEADQEDIKPTDKRTDYLQWLREKNKNRPVESAQAFIQKLDKTALSREQKAKRIMEFTDRLQKKAKRRQQLQKSTTGTDNELDGLYLQAIEAKLNLLQDI